MLGAAGLSGALFHKPSVKVVALEAVLQRRTLLLVQVGADAGGASVVGLAVGALGVASGAARVGIGLRGLSRSYL